MVVFIKLNKKSEIQEKNIKTNGRSSSIFALCNHTTFGKTQTGATVPLKSE
jgi:hypothetical protein